MFCWASAVMAVTWWMPGMLGFMACSIGLVSGPCCSPYTRNIDLRSRAPSFRVRWPRPAVVLHQQDLPTSEHAAATVRRLELDGPARSTGTAVSEGDLEVSEVTLAVLVGVDACARHARPSSACGARRRSSARHASSSSSLIVWGIPG